MIKKIETAYRSHDSRDIKLLRVKNQKYLITEKLYSLKSLIAIKFAEALVSLCSSSVVAKNLIAY